MRVKRNDYTLDSFHRNMKKQEEQKSHVPLVKFVDCTVVSSRIHLSNELRQYFGSNDT